MFGPPADTPALWVGLALVGALFVGLALQIPRAPAPDANAVAGTVDAAAASQYPTRAAHPTTARAYKATNRSLALRSDGGVSHATLTYGPVTPAVGELSDVLAGAPPAGAFENSSAFADAAAAARRNATWRAVDGALSVRTVTWGETDVTLVG